MYNSKTRYNGWHVQRTTYRALVRQPSLWTRIINWVLA